MKNLIAVLLLMPLIAFGQSFEKRSFKSSEDVELPYRILFPDNYDSSEKYPLLLFLHGYGERGTDNEAQLTHGSELFLKKENREQFPAIVVFPQCPAGDSRWVPYERAEGSKPWRVPFYEKASEPLQAVIELVEKLIEDERIDQDRLYAMGLSMGGFGTFELIARMPHRFAAAVPICGGGNTATIGLYANTTAVWIFHGAADNVVPVSNSQKMFQAIKKWNDKVKYTEYPDVQHDSWTPTFAEPELLNWIFSHSLEK